MLFPCGCPRAPKVRVTWVEYTIRFQRLRFSDLSPTTPSKPNLFPFSILSKKTLISRQMFLNVYESIPYNALRYLIAECNYGGRISDKSDRLTMSMILEHFINENVVNDLRYKFGEDDIYILPRKSEHREMVRYIQENIPTRPNPEVYGLNPNAGIKRELEVSSSLLESMVMATTIKHLIQDAMDNGNGVTPKLTEILKHLPIGFNLEDAKQRYPVSFENVMNTILIQEMERYEELLELIRKTCRDLMDAIDGTIPMTPDLENVMVMIKLDKIPNLWVKHSYETAKSLGPYIQDFIRRIRWIEKWFV